MATLYRVLDVSENELSALIQEVIPEKTKIARKYCIKGKKKWIFDSSTRRIVAGVSSAMHVLMYSIIVY